MTDPTTISGLRILESGLKSLKRSKLMVAREYNDMIGAIELHHSSLCLSHLTGISKDMVDQAQRDTRFYNILVKMLCELKEKRTGEQRQGLRKIYAWYVANKHVLYSGPRFGKERLKCEAKDTVLTTHKLRHGQSVHDKDSKPQASIRPTSASNIEAPHSNIWQHSSFDWRTDLQKGLVPAESGNFESGKVEDGPTFSVADAGTSNVISTIGNKHNGLASTVHPVPSIVNPHVALAVQMEGERKMQNKLLANTSPSHNLLTWMKFNNDRSYGQDLVGRLSFVGRSGTPRDVRYVAHANGETPEHHTQAVIMSYAKAASANVLANDGSDYEEQKENVFLHQSLEQFYQSADTCSPRVPTHPQSTRSQSAPVTTRSVLKNIKSSEQGTPGRKTTQSKFRQDLQNVEQDKEKDKEEMEERTNVTLETVVDIIDSVSANMVHYKEKFASEVQPGFRQPIVNDLPASSSPILYMPIPSGRSSISIENQQVACRPHTSPISLHWVSMAEELGGQIHSLNPSFQKDGTRLSGMSDGSGRVQPDSLRYKWRKTKYGGFTYQKNLPTKNVSMRSAGATSAGRRPKTASITMREKWKTHNPSDQNQRLVSQAASHCTAQIDQKAVDSMITVRHLLGSSLSRTDSLTSLYNFDEDFLASLSHADIVPSSGQLEYVSFVTPASVAAGEKMIPTNKTEPLVDELQDKEDTVNMELSPAPRNIHMIPLEQALDRTDVEANSSQMHADEEFQWEQQPQEVPEMQHVKKENLDYDEVTLQEETGRSDNCSVQSLDEVLADTGAITQVTAVASEVRLVSSSQGNFQQLSKSEVWEYSPCDDADSEKKLRGGTGNCLEPTSAVTPQLHTQVFCASCLPLTSTRATVQGRRSVGGMPRQMHNGSNQMLQLARRRAELIQLAPPRYTPPSIPCSSARLSAAWCGARVGPLMSELEHHARKVKSPRSLMQHVQNLRSTGSSPNRPASQVSTAELLSATLQVSRLNTPLRRYRNESRLEDIGSDSDVQEDGLHFPGQHAADESLMGENSGIKNTSDDSMNADETEVTGFMPDAANLNLAQRPVTAPASLSKKHRATECRELLFQGIGHHHIPLSGSQRNSTSSRPSSVRSTNSSRSLANIGRPIPQATNIPDPDELKQAVQRQREAAAAVDIQRAFRGFTARNIYKKLLSEEQEKLENERRAAVAIQRRYRAHLIHKRVIKLRSPSEELQQWSKNYQAIQETNKQDRLRKLKERSDENAMNYMSAKSRISIIGPHVDIYEIYHPPKTGHDRMELNSAAVCIQRHVRGWLVRRCFEKLKRKAGWYGSTFQKMGREYKSVLVRVLCRHGVNHPKIPFDAKEMSDYMDMRRRYESVFEKKAFSGQLEMEDVEAFFHECDLYPSKTEVEDAVDVVLQGQPAAKRGHGLKRHEVLDILFYIYPPPAAGLKNTRQSTWMNPIINGVEARQLIGNEFVEEAPLEVCAELVCKAIREQKEKERVQKHD